ncbi:MAG: deoxyribodipyrimidine photo-lyase [Planctomycetota bacterium]|jgi:deoxyribodipyrimidine photo-lyase
MRTLVWFRSDLRVRDNPALWKACCESDDEVVGVFVMSPRQWRVHDWADRRVGFVLKNLRELSESLRGLNIALRVVVAEDFHEVAPLLLELARELGCNELVFNDEYEVNERERDERVIDLFEEAGHRVRTFCDQCVVEPGELRTGQGTFYKVFTPFRRAWLRAFEDNYELVALLPAPEPRKVMAGAPDAIPDRVDGFECDRSGGGLWPAGESGAHDRLSSFLSERLGVYKRDRDFPALEGASGLSPYLTSGVLSVRQCFAGAIEANDGCVDTGSEGAICWISELIWREFYRHILVGFPRVSRHRAFKPSTERLRWSSDDALYRAWCEGMTGYPIVDAGMRQLRETGWMHNRLRMITSMFFSKNLFLDWRLGERHFMRHLIDGDLASNNGGWQWSASTGCDAAPYFRIFNPCAQSKRFDPRGEFIRRFVPELSGVDVGWLHDPERMPGSVRAESNYPRPIVEYAESRQRAIDAFQELRGA